MENEMGLLDSLTGLLSSQSEDGTPAVMSLLNMLIGDRGQEGGLGAIIGQLQSSGLGDQVASWLGSGDNLPVSGEQLQEALSGDTLGQLGSMLNLGEGDVAGQLSQMLPNLVDKLSPNGDMEVAQTDSSEVLGMLGSLLK